METTRRGFMTHVAGASALVAAPAVAIAAQPVSPAERLHNALREAEAAMREMLPDHPVVHRDLTVHRDGNHVYGMIFASRFPGESGHVYVDDGSPLRADDVTGTTAYADWARARGYPTT